MTEQVLAAARKIVDSRAAEEAARMGRVVTMSELRAAVGTAAGTASEARLTDVMNTLAASRLVRLVTVNPERKWYVSAPEPAAAPAQ